MTKPAISYEEIAQLIRDIIADPNALRLKNPPETWDEIYCGDVHFTFKGWRFAIYNDCGECDYFDHVTAPDGRTGVFDHWCSEHGEHPIEQLSSADLYELETAAENAR